VERNVPQAEAIDRLVELIKADGRWVEPQNQNGSMKILPLAYLGSLEWWRAALSEEAIIDVGEHFVKQSARSRCEIATASGRMTLSANVVKASSIHKRAVKDMRLDYSKRWQHQHAVAIRSAYKS
jgi:hypothetical protein